VDQRLAAVQVQAASRTGDRVVGHGQEDEVGLIEDVGRVGEGARAGNE